ncbi:hypothetical protein [Sphingomonas kyeonggiensis]|uniref:Uncharacterized protein n=1 Tax=Sphingomonas kyeonggiensis TaxID=1268553 RepID=A0A7W6JVS9_9SPHN|nr:hypothetical protein [Sphingomonas kyeonggiensis]MBB4100484.1 hypothetical protein [Sphingomonas kyeonggiensis]
MKLASGHRILNTVSHPVRNVAPTVSAQSATSWRDVLVVATCSAGKRVRGAATAERLAISSQLRVAEEWTALLQRERHLVPAKDLYCGRAFGLVRSAAEQKGASLAILSAGLGFVRGEIAVPGYDLTVRPGKPGSVTDRIAGDFCARAWWRAVQQGPFASEFPSAARQHGLVLLALSKAYLDLVVDDLLAIEREWPGRLRLFGLSLDRHLPVELTASFMPYDARLETAGRAGTRTDFAARALDDFMHYADFGASTREHVDMVERRLAGAPAPRVRSPQRRADDASIQAALRTVIGSRVRSSAQALTWLRSVQGVSCEQRRFANLYRQVILEGVA